jgi:LCP family protein required for cell wall assembly
MPEEKSKSKHKGKSKVKKASPDFVYDPSKHHEAEENSLATELDPMRHQNHNQDNRLLEEKREKKAKRKKRIKKGFLITLLLLLLAGGGIALYLFLKAGKISTNPFKLSTKLKGEDTGRVNILLLGVGDPGHDGETLADTNMIISLDTKNNKVAMISIPRDTRVRIPGEGYAKINNANALGEAQGSGKGVALAEKTIQENFGIEPQYYIKANFTGLKQAVDAVGGIDINVKEALSDPEYPCDNNQYKSCGFKISPGQVRMDGTTALKYARCRKGTCGDDFGRGLRQQEVLQAIKAKAMSSSTLSDPKKLNSLIEAVANNIKTDMSLSEIQRAYEIAKKVPPENVTSVVFSLQPNGFLKSDPSSSDLLPSSGNFDEIKKFIANIFTVGPIWVEDPKIVIENGTTTSGLAGKLENKINNAGVPIDILAIQNAKTKDYTTSQIIDYSNGKKPNTIKYLEDLLGVKATQGDQKAKPGAEDIVVIIGSDYAEKLTQSGTTQE